MTGLGVRLFFLLLGGFLIATGYGLYGWILTSVWAYLLLMECTKDLE